MQLVGIYQVYRFIVFEKLHHSIPTGCYDNGLLDVLRDFNFRDPIGVFVFVKLLRFGHYFLVVVDLEHPPVVVPDCYALRLIVIFCAQYWFVI